MATETKSVIVKGKQVKIVTFADNEVSPEVVTSLLCRGSSLARISLVEDTTKVMTKALRKKLVKDVFRGQQ